jgi:HAD superfamily hydrolase (TIGR01509 family)
MDAVIFDLDGLLADTEPLHCAAYRAALHEVGVEIDDAEYEDHWIRRGLGIVELCAQMGVTTDPVAIRARKLELYANLLRRELRPMPGARALVDSLRSHYALAIATSSLRESADAVLERLEFDLPCVVTASDVKRAKPHPDGLFEAARRLAVAPPRCVVLDDAEKGVLAAVAAGMVSIAVPNAQTAHHDFSRATRVVTSLEALSPNDIAALLQ